MTVGEEAHKFSVRGPERKGGAAGAFELMGRQVDEGLHPDEIAIFLASGAERNSSPVGSDRGWPGKIAGEVEARSRRRRKIRAQRQPRLALAQPPPPQTRQQSQNP